MGIDRVTLYMEMIKGENFVEEKGMPLIKEQVSSILLDTSPRSVSGTVV